MEKVNQVLYTKAWMCHSMVSISRVFYPLSGTSLWQEAYLTRDEIKNLDKVILRLELSNHEVSGLKRQNLLVAPIK